jgi:hypothetical protein
MTATSSSSDIGVTTPYLWIAQGASVSVPLTARVVSLGAPQSGVTVNFMVAQGSGSLSAPSAVTNSQGYASVTLTLTNFSTSIQLNACVAPGNNPCQNIYGNAVAAALLNLQAMAGAGQVVTGTAFQPLVVRVTDSSTPPNAVLGANVVFQSAVLRPGGNDLTTAPGDPIVTQTGMPVILSASQSTTASDANGLASFVPSVGSFTARWRLTFRSRPELQPYSRTNWRAFRPAAAGTLPPPLASGTEVFPLRVGGLCKRLY